MPDPNPNLADDLKLVPIFADLEPGQREWLAAHGVEVWLEAGETAIAEGAPADRMVALLSGEIHGRRERGPQDGRIFVMRPGDVGGMLPFSRMTTFTATARAVARSRLVWIAAAHFPEMLRQIPALEPRLVGILTDRVREATRVDQQREKLMALGKLSAGLAHELNNPAAAVQRSASELRDRLVALRSLAARLIECDLAPRSMQAAVAIYRAAIERSRAGREPDPVALGDREEALGQWLEEHGVERPWLLAGTFAGFGVEPPELDGLATVAAGPALPCLVSWMEGGLAAEGLLGEINTAAHRITELVAAIKSYSHMDEAQARADVDLRRELDSTLTMLAHKVRKKGVQVAREFERDLPAIEAFPGELNQVWTNLLDNAIDAVSPGGHIVVRAAREGDLVNVEVRDDGPGIPPEIQPRIWEPFFTTKPVGEGTGLGLEVVHRIVVRRHGGAVSVSSVPGDTRFSVRLPLHASAAIGQPPPAKPSGPARRIASPA
jgi:signal transduction histidine kinase